MRVFKLLRFAWRFYTLFRLVGVPVQVHTTWLVFPCGFLLLGFCLSAGWTGLILGILLLSLLLASLLTHEFAHVLAAKHCGCNTRRVLVIPFACIADLEAIPLEIAEIRVAAAGPLASFLLSALAWLAAQFIDGAYQTGFWYAHMVITGFCFLNLGLACFNLLPCFPMDGGRILRSTLAIAIGRFFPSRASSALVLATRVAVRYVARPIACGIVFLTVFHTHLWHHLLIFTSLILAGELEYWLIRKTIVATPDELRFLPLTQDSFHASPRPLRLRIDPQSPRLTCARRKPCDTVGRTARACPTTDVCWRVFANAGVAKWQTHRT
jgi:Zn-dependent protease